MAELPCATELVEQMVFGWATNPVRIVGVRHDPKHNNIVFDIEGDDVPNSEQVTATISVQRNRANQVFHTMTFEAAK